MITESHVSESRFFGIMQPDEMRLIWIELSPDVSDDRFLLDACDHDNDEEIMGSIVMRSLTVLN